MLTEDNPDEVELALLGFERIDGPYQVQVAPDGESALDFLFATGAHANRLSRLQPSLVLLDINLPRIDGFEVLRRMRQAPLYRNTPVVMLTTSDERSDLLRGYHLGADSYLCKPMDFDSFTDLLEQVTRRWLATDSHPVPAPPA